MKKIIYIAVLLIGFSCTESSVPDPVRPSHLPKNLPRNWGTYEQAAWEQGRIVYNQDSSMVMIIGERDYAKILGIDPKKVEEAKAKLFEQ